MGTNISRCEAAADPSIVPPPLPKPRRGPSSGPPPQDLPPGVTENLKFNPGSYEEVHKQCKEIFPVPFEGAKISINKSLNQVLSISHTFTMSSFVPSGYRFGCSYVGGAMITPQYPQIILMSDTDPSANLNAQGVINFSEGVRVKYLAQVMNSRFVNTQFTSDLRGQNWTVNGTLVNLNFFNNTGIGILQYLQAITPRVCLGAEVMHQRAPGVPGDSMTLLNMCARYTADASVWSGHVGTCGLGLSYYRRINQEFQIGIELQNSYLQEGPSVMLGYQFDLPEANFSMKGMIDNNLTVTGVLEKRLLPMPFMLSLCGSINHLKNQFRVGCGFIIGV